MALIKCPECNKEISSSAKLCPHCGCDFFSMLKNRFQIQFIIFDQSQKPIYSFEKYPQDGNVGILIINQINAFAEFRVNKNILSILYEGEKKEYLLTPFGFVRNVNGTFIPDGEYISYETTINSIYNPNLPLIFKINGTGLYNKTPMNYYKTDNFILVETNSYGLSSIDILIKYENMWYHTFYATKTLNGQSKLVEEYNDLYKLYLANKKEPKAVNYNTVQCPYCHSHDTNQIGILSRMFSTGFFGLGSKKLGKQWHCNSCGSDF